MPATNTDWEPVQDAPPISSSDWQPVAAPEKSDWQPVQPAAALVPPLPPLQSLSPEQLQSESSFQPSQFSSGLPPSVPIADNPDYGMLKAAAPDIIKAGQGAEKALDYAGNVARGGATDVVNWTIDPAVKGIYGNVGHPDKSNVVAALKGDAQLPVDISNDELAQSHPYLAAASDVAQEGLKSAPLLLTGALDLPAVVNKAVALGFSGQMIAGVKDLASQYGGQMGLNPEDRDPAKVARLRAGLISTGLFAPLAGAHGASADASLIAKKVLPESVSSPLTKQRGVFDPSGNNTPQTPQSGFISAAQGLRPKSPLEQQAPQRPSPQQPETSGGDAGEVMQGDDARHPVTPFDKYQDAVARIKSAPPDQKQAIAQEIENLKNLDASPEKGNAPKGSPPLPPHESVDFNYSDSDLKKYQDLKASQQKLFDDGDAILDVKKPTERRNPEFVQSENQLEQLRNKYNGNPPKQFSKKQVVKENLTTEKPASAEDLTESTPLDENGNVIPRGQAARPVRQPQLQPLGADLAAQPRQGSPTAMKYRLIDQERQQRGLEPLAKPAGVSDQAVMDKAMAEVDRNPSLPDRMVSELNTKPRSIDAWERMVLLLHKIDLRHEYEKSANEAAQAFDDSKEYPDRKADMVAANLRTADLSDQLTKLENASRASGSEQGRGLRSLRIMANEDYSLASLETQRRAAKGGEPLTDSERDDLKKIADDYKKANDELTAHLAAARLRISTLEAGKALTEIQKTPRLPKGADIGAQKTRLQGIIGSKIKAGKLDEITNPIQRLARLFVQGGISDRDELIDAVHGVLKDADPSITRRDTMDAISGYGDFKQLSKDEISVRLRGMKGEMQQISKLEDMAKGVPPSKTGIERRTPTDAERKLIKAVNEAKIKFQVPITDPATQLKSALDTRKIQLQRQIEAMKEKMASGDFEKAPRRELVLDRRAQELQAEKERVAKKFKRQQADAFNKNKRFWAEKVPDFISNLRRFAVLSGVNVVGKLAAYSATKIPTMAATELVGNVYSKIPKLNQVFEKAPSEGAVSLKTFSKSMAKGLTQGWIDAYKTGRYGQSDLRAAYSNRIESGHEWYNFFQTIHEIEKSPLRRAAFELSLAKRIENGQRNGVDVTDPMTQLAMGKDAYIDSDRALLLENNRLASGIRGLFKQLEAKDKKTGTVPLHGKIAATFGRVELPILSVPLNYVKQTLTSAFGLVSGSVKLRAAFSDGIENLKPEEADAIARHLKYGTIGGAALLYGFIDGYKNGANGTFGGFYQPGEKRKDNQAGVGGIRVAGHNIPGLFLHNPVLAVAQMGHTIGAIMATKLNKKTDQTHSLPVAAAAGLMGLLNQSPLGNVVEGASQLSDPRSAEWAMGEHVKGLVDPQLSQEIAQWMDKNAQGKVIKRDPKTITQHVETGIPILRKNVPEKVPPKTKSKPQDFTLDLSPLNR